ncbi:MAG: methylenetetrahydrofolate reductase [NAD(P)H] [Nitrospirae bacterium]|nr:methylenetetrahydrofolate reductase [NAD(P)H] [Nitrospirota bacterium]
MKILQLLDNKRPLFSFEFFPPKTHEGEINLFKTIANLRELEPAFVSVTYGAGGGTREKTVGWVIRIKQELGIEAMAHLTCVNSTAGEIAGILTKLQENGIENILALRGDKPQNEELSAPPQQSFNHANELIQFIRKNYDFCIGAAAFPEGHRESRSLEEDTHFLKKKADAGTDFFITQLFFDNRFYFDLIERANKTGINKPIIPGIMPITNIEQIERFTSLCGAAIPEGMRRKFETIKNNPDAVMELGIHYATDQCRELLERGVPGIHFYTLNRSPATVAILKDLIGK